MRLTLRTLLAYLDDVLEPAQTKEIGQKIQQSPVAAALVSRVREVIRRRRLAAPDVQGATQGLDANLVAQYLDNTLREDQVSDVERVCLESDLELAEVASCHQILTLVLGEPLDMAPSRLEKFYALGPVSSDERSPATLDGSPRRPPVPAQETVRTPPPPRDFHEGLPDYLRPTPWPQRVAPAAGIAVVLIGAVLALLLDPTFVRTLVGIKTPTAGVEGRPAAQPAGGRPVRPAAPAAQEPPGTAIAAATPAAPTTTMPPLPADIDPTPPPDAPETTPPTVAATSPIPAAPMPSAPATSGVSATTVANVPTEPPKPMPPMPTVAPPPVVETKERIFVPMQYTSTDGILMRYQRSDQHWYVQPRRAELHAEEVLACPEPFEARFDLDAGLLDVLLLGDTVVQILPPSENFRIRLELRKGRVILKPGAEAGERPVALQLTAGEREWDIRLTTRQTIAAVERTTEIPSGTPFPKAPSWWQLSLLVAAGQVQVATDNAPQVTVSAAEMYRMSGGTEAGGVVPILPVPDWLDAERRNLSTVLRRYGLLFEREFDASAAVDQSIPALVRDPRPKIAELATRCLATMETPAELMLAFARSEHAESRGAAVRGLRTWLVQDEARVDTLKELVDRYYAGAEGKAVAKLLVGLSPQEARDRLSSLQVVEWLRSNFVEVRELAIEQLEKFSGRRYDYRPLGSPSQREPAIQRWMGHVDREGGIVKPE